MTNTPFQQQELDKIKEEFKYYLKCGEKELTQCEEDPAYIRNMKNLGIFRNTYCLSGAFPAKDEDHFNLLANINVNHGIPHVNFNYPYHGYQISYTSGHYSVTISFSFRNTIGMKPNSEVGNTFRMLVNSYTRLATSVIYEVKRRETEYFVQEISTLQEQVKILVTNVGALKQENADLKQAISDISDRQITLDQENVILRQEVDMLKKHTNLYPSYDYDAIRLRMDVHRVELMHTQRIISKIARRNLTHPLPIALVVKHD